MENKVRFFGDTRTPWKDLPVAVFREIKTITDFTECGLWVGSGLARKYKYEVIKLSEALNLFEDNFEIESSNNGFAKFFTENNIKTIADFKRYLSKH